ncbi:MAG: helix-turn-helix domain-containing protein [Methanosarcinales archaeon Met12]|nr:MAG: helix-turn-helix domain-containing protein [Methanosarcinales archaeon Met12]
MKSPCELIVWYVLPSIRYELTKELLKLGLSQKEVSERLGITQAAVSQYVKEKRGKTMKFKEEAKDAIRRLTNDIAEDGAFDDLIPRLCRICTQIRISGELCELHKGQEVVQEDCDVCLRTL